MCRQNHLTLKVLQTLLGDLIIFMEQKLNKISLAVQKLMS